MPKIIDAFEYLYEKMRISPDNILFISDTEFIETQLSDSQIGDVLRYLKVEKVFLRDNRKMKSDFSRIPIEHEERLKYLKGFLGNPFLPEWYTILEFSSREDFFKAYEKFKSGKISSISTPSIEEAEDNISGWEKITIRFLSEEDVLIEIFGQSQKEATPKSMGLIDRRNGRPNSQWKLLFFLAQNRGQVSWDNNSSLKAKEVASVTKKKQNLSKCLKKYFHLKEDPFFPYKDEYSYRIKLHLIPFRKDDISDPDPMGINVAIREQTHNVYEDDSSEE